jgi:hypothetical protein
VHGVEGSVGDFSIKSYQFVPPTPLPLPEPTPSPSSGPTRTPSPSPGEEPGSTTSPGVDSCSVIAGSLSCPLDLALSFGGDTSNLSGDLSCPVVQQSDFIAASQNGLCECRTFLTMGVWKSQSIVIVMPAPQDLGWVLPFNVRKESLEVAEPSIGME